MKSVPVTAESASIYPRNLDRYVGGTGPRLFARVSDPSPHEYARNRDLKFICWPILGVPLCRDLDGIQCVLEHVDVALAMIRAILVLSKRDTE